MAAPREGNYGNYATVERAQDIATTPEEVANMEDGRKRTSKMRHGCTAVGLGMLALAAYFAVSLWNSPEDVSGGAVEIGVVTGALPAKYEKDSDDEEDEATWVQGKDFDSMAPEMDVDIQYIGAAGWGTHYDHIPSPEMCSALCQGVAKCNAYTWVKNAGLDGCPSQCWLMEGVSEKKKLKGLVSGKPPARVAFKDPPASKKAASGTLYCYSLMLPKGYERGLLKWQHEHGAGIFGCDKAAIYSNQPIKVAPGYVAEVVNSTLKCGFGGDSMSALNSWIFIEVWRKLIEVGDYKQYDWVVKVDPDCVFFPTRLSKMLLKHDGAAYINNCKYGMHGPIEVFSKRAIDALEEDYGRSWDGHAPKKCVTEQHFGQWGEDMFIDQCLDKILDVKPRPLDSTLMCESHCDCDAWYWCNENEETVSFHPFKTIDAYSNCVANAMHIHEPLVVA